MSRKFKKLNNKAPPCVSCLLDQVHKTPWGFTKTKNGSAASLNPYMISKPADTIRVEQLISAQPGLVPQTGGSLTRDRIWAANLVVDHYTDVHKAVLMRSPSTEETLAAKLATEKFFRQHGVKISQWHADNGRYADKEFIEQVDKHEQKITFCGVGASKTSVRKDRCSPRSRQ